MTYGYVRRGEPANQTAFDPDPDTRLRLTRPRPLVPLCGTTMCAPRRPRSPPTSPNIPRPPRRKSFRSRLSIRTQDRERITSHSAIAPTAERHRRHQRTSPPYRPRRPTSRQRTPTSSSTSGPAGSRSGTGVLWPALSQPSRIGQSVRVSWAWSHVRLRAATGVFGDRLWFSALLVVGFPGGGSWRGWCGCGRRFWR